MSSDLAASLRLVKAADEDPLMIALEQQERFCEARLLEIRDAKEKRLLELKELTK